MAVFGVTAWYIYVKIRDYPSINDFFQVLVKPGHGKTWFVLLVIVLMFLNWGLETIKWKKLIDVFEKISPWRAFRAVWSGLTINSWIPNRLAEFLGRILYISSENRGKAVFSAFTGNLAQLLMTLGFGSAGLVVWLGHMDSIPRTLIAIALAAMMIIAVYAFFNIGRLQKVIGRIPLLNKFSDYALVMAEYSKSRLLEVFFLSMFRYAVYTFQYFILLKVFGVETPWYILLALVPVIFLIQTFLPSFTWIEIGIRGATVLFVIGRYSNEINSMLAAAFLLWIINIIIPTIAGAFFIATIRKKEKTI